MIRFGKGRMMTEKKVILDGGAMPFSKVVQKGSTVYISGMVGRNDADGTIPFSAADQTRVLMDKLNVLLGSVNATLDNALKITIFVTDMRYFSEINAVYKTYFSEGLMPARSCVAVTALPDPDAKVEMEVIAEVPNE